MDSHAADVKRQLQELKDEKRISFILPVHASDIEDAYQHPKGEAKEWSIWNGLADLYAHGFVVLVVTNLRIDEQQMRQVRNAEARGKTLKMREYLYDDETYKKSRLILYQSDDSEEEIAKGPGPLHGSAHLDCQWYHRVHTVPNVLDVAQPDQYFRIVGRPARYDQTRRNKVMAYKVDRVPKEEYLLHRLMVPYARKLYEVKRRTGEFH